MRTTTDFTVPRDLTGRPDGYVVLRKSSLAWLLERHRLAGQCELPGDVATDLGEAIVDVDAPVPAEDRLRTLGPILSLDQHAELLEEDENIGLPRDVQGERFWRTVAGVVHAMLENEGRAALQLLGGNK